MNFKICSTCKIYKPLSRFGKDRRSTSGLRSQCKKCEKKYRSAYERNRDPEKKHAYAKKYRETHKDIEKARYKNWIENNPEKYRGKRTADRMRRRSSGRVGDKDITLEKLYNRDGGICALCGKPCNYTDFVFQGEVFIAGNNYPSIDHIEPLSKGGSHTWDNVQLAHKICNSKKSNKDLINF